MHLTLTEFAPAKINLALHVLGRRPGGYHEIDSIVAFADQGDELRFTPSTEFSIAASGPFAHKLPAPEANIIHAAWKALAAIAKARGKTLPPVHVALTKNLPVAAGIGGGSANAAASLRAFIKLADLGAIPAEVAAAALALGADVPVCLLGKPCRMRGMGERITPLPDFQPLDAVLINPLIAVSTAAVFRQLGIPMSSFQRSPDVGYPADPATWRNDLTAPAIAVAPVIAEVIAAIAAQPGLRFARMSGSGATCFGIFESEDAARRAERALSQSYPQYWTRAARLA